MALARSAWGGKLTIAAVLVAIFLADNATAAADPPVWLRRVFTLHVGGRGLRGPMVARYAIDGGGGFTLDRAERQPLLKFDNSVEIWSLTASRGPRGDVIFFNDLGQPMLRATKLGGMTVFTRTRPGGSAAVLAGTTSPLRLASIGPAALYERLLQASARTSRFARHLVGFEATNADPASDGLIGDTAMVASEALVDLSTAPGGRALLARVGKVDILQAPQPGALLRAGVVSVMVTPAWGVSGRPSSLRIQEAIGLRH